MNWTSSVAKMLNLINCTLHLAVKLLDYFMDGHDIQDPQLHLVSLGSLLLAEEKASIVPKYSKLNTFLKNQVSLSNFLNLEYMILTFFNFHLSLPTTCHFTEMLLPYSILPTDCHNGKAKDYQCVKYFLDVALQEVFFCGHFT